MTHVSIALWAIWAAFVLFLAVLYLYRSGLARDEEDQIFLDDSFDHERAAQAVIVSKVAKVEPLLKVARWLVLTMTAVVIVYYVHDILAQLGMVR